jgi:hypothetical protein
MLLFIAVDKHIIEKIVANFSKGLKWLCQNLMKIASEHCVTF